MGPIEHRKGGSKRRAERSLPAARRTESSGGRRNVSDWRQRREAPGKRAAENERLSAEIEAAFQEHRAGAAAAARESAALPAGRHGPDRPAHLEHDDALLDLQAGEARVFGVTLELKVGDAMRELLPLLTTAPDA
ncbi:hypothetical protein [Synechococcus sp. CS-1332]|uniref:hypothetical protein n=1 Tax=Synechococcus sp. CS-1332 TaxID=2847972 RepID=UPI00223BFCF6|nr:hypothetical protein [Synechococcus sp. CS-1332]MCT0208955.1 hypothetical protein [Synechococcus sp. CS-1332]